MKRIKNSSSSLSDCDLVEDRRSCKPEPKNLRLEDTSLPTMNPLVELVGLGENVGLTDLGTMLLSFKHETASTLTSLNTAFNQFRLELQGEMKLVQDEMVEQKNSIDCAWAEVEALQAEMMEQKAAVQILKTDVNNL